MASKAKATIEITAEDKASRELKKISKQFSGIERKLTSLGKTATAALTLPAGLFGASAFREFAAFEQEMAKVKAVSGATGQEFANLQKNAEQLGAATRFSASEVAGLQLEYSKLGFSAQEITQVTKSTLALAQASGSDLAESAAVAGSTLRAFGISAEETGRVTDVMAKSFSTSALDLSKFSESMKYVAPVSKAAGISLEETAGLMAVLADNGISGSMAGTSLKNIIGELTKDGKPLSDVLANLSEQNLSLADAEALVGKNAQSALLILANNAMRAKELTGVYENAKGAAQGMADVMDDTARGAIARFQSAMSALQISVGGVLAKAFLPIVEQLGPMVASFAELSPQLQTLIVSAGGAAAALGPLLLIGGQVAGVISTIAGMAAGISFAPIIAGVAGVAAAGFLLVKNWDTVKAAALALKESAIAAFNDWRERNAETIARISASFASIRETFGRVVAALGERTQEAIGWLDGFLEPLGGIEGAWKSMQIVIGAVIDTLTGLIGDWFAGLASNFSIVADVLEGNKSAWEGLKEIVGNAASYMLSKVKESLGNIKTAFGSIDWGSLGSAIMDGIKSGIANGAKSVADAATNAASNAFNAVKSKLGIRSPSREFAKLGKFAMAGLAIGIAQGAHAAGDQAELSAVETLLKFEAGLQKQQEKTQAALNKALGVDVSSLSFGDIRGGGGYGDSFGAPVGSSIPGKAEIDALNSYYDERLNLLTERGHRESELVRSIELEKMNALADLRSQQIAGFGQSFDAILALTQSFAGEQSGIYQGLFAASKGFAIAESIIKIQQGIANALSLPFPANLGAAATVAGRAAGIVSTIKGTNLQSFEGGGFTGMGARTGGVDGKGGIPAIVHPNETVIDHTKGQSAGGLTVVIHVNGDASPEQVQKIEATAVSKAIQIQEERERRGGSRA